MKDWLYKGDGVWEKQTYLKYNLGSNFNLFAGVLPLEKDCDLSSQIGINVCYYFWKLYIYFNISLPGYAFVQLYLVMIVLII